ncbi:MAG: magnesium transporter CorA family protein [Candidatus Hydrogenedentes bacterium]|nr:magnesium transporter CorA family protein [Candidatus Hydrogenedentota bacterium]
MQKKFKLANGYLVETQDDDAPIVFFAAPDDAEKCHLIEALNIDQHTLSSALDPDELSRLEFEPDHAALIMKRPRNYCAKDQFLFRVTSMGLFLYQDRLIVVAAEDDTVFAGKPLVAMHTPLDVVLRLLYRHIFHFLEHLRVINMVTDELEDKINASMENRFLINLFTLEKSLVYYLNAIHTNSVLISKLRMNAAKLGMGIEQIEFLDDVGVENDQCYRLSEIYSNVLSGLMDARVSIVSNNLNVIMKTLTIVTIGIMVPTFVVSAFSMNVALPFLKNDNPWTFWIVVGLAVASGLGVTLYWRFKKLF